jgi:hypothetical protein
MNLAGLAGHRAGIGIMGGCRVRWRLVACAAMRWLIPAGAVTAWNEMADESWLIAV